MDLIKIDSELDAPNEKQISAKEKPPKSEILDDNPNLKDTELDNFKKHEDNVDPAKKKKMKEDADAEVGKGKDHDSKVKALDKDGNKVLTQEEANKVVANSAYNRNAGFGASGDKKAHL